MKFSPSLHADAFAAVAGHPQIENRVRNENGREHGSHDTERQRDGKTANGAGAELIQNGRRDDGGQVGVGNGHAGPAEPGVHRLGRAEPQFQFLADALVNKHVGVHGHTDGQYNPRDARQGERRAESRHARHEQGKGKAQHNVGDKAGNSVIKRHNHNNGRVRQIVDHILTLGKFSKIDVSAI